MTIRELLVTRLATDPASPLLTWYNDDLGQRIELSTASFANWVAKAAHLLLDECGLGTGSRVRLDLPLHWQAMAVQHAVWCIGATVADGREPLPAPPPPIDVLVRRADDAPDVVPARDVIGLALAPIGVPGPPQPAHRIDFDREISGFPDVLPHPGRNGVPHEDRNIADVQSAVIKSAQEFVDAHDLKGRRFALRLPSRAQLEPMDPVLVSLVGETGVVVSLGATPPRVDEDRASAERALMITTSY